MTAHRQLTDTVLLVSPDTFGFNPETASSNVFQNKSENALAGAKKEFEAMVKILKDNDINVVTISSPADKITPDAIFPNNWFSTHEDGTLVVYPMLAPNRRDERQVTVLQKLFNIKNVIDLTSYERHNMFLEGTGSVVLDRKNKTAFAVESPRTTKDLFHLFCKYIGYKGMLFHAEDKTGVPIYHTNVLMNIGDGFVVLCLDAIKDITEKNIIREEFKRTNTEVIDISFDQLHAFCGNVLHLVNKKGERIIVLSQAAYDAFSDGQKQTLQKYGKLLPVHVSTIEKVGGGSARCMLAEIFL